MTTTQTAITHLLDAVETLTPRAKVIRNSSTLAHVARPNRVRATWVLSLLSDGTVSGTRLDGRGYVVGSWNNITAEEIVSGLKA